MAPSRAARSKQQEVGNEIGIARPRHLLPGCGWIVERKSRLRTGSTGEASA